VRPDWLTDREGARLELDYLIEELDIAVEVQGEQHYHYVPYFHGSYDQFLKRVERDKIKREKCTAVGIMLLEIDSSSQFKSLKHYLIKRVQSASVSPRVNALAILKEIGYGAWAIPAPHKAYRSMVLLAAVIDRIKKKGMTDKRQRILTDGLHSIAAYVYSLGNRLTDAQCELIVEAYDFLK